MDSLNQLELQNIRHICGKVTNCNDKITYYKTLTQDSKVIEVLNNLEQKITSLKSELTSMIV